MTDKTASPAPEPKRSATVDLDEPLPRGEQQITQIQLRKPNSGELRGLNLVSLMQLDVTTLITLLPRISSPSLTPVEAAALAPEDLMQIGAEVMGFFMTAQEKAILSGSPEPSKTPTPISH